MWYECGTNVVRMWSLPKMVKNGTLIAKLTYWVKIEHIVSLLESTGFTILEVGTESELKKSNESDYSSCMICFIYTSKASFQNGITFIFLLFIVISSELLFV